MKFHLKPNAELDLLTKEELREVVAEAMAAFEKEITDRDYPSENGVTSAAGAGSLVVYTAQVGMEFRLQRLVVVSDGASFAVPFVAAAGAVELRKNGVTFDGRQLSAANGGLPAVFSYSGQAGPRFRNGDEFEVALIAGPAAVNWEARAEGDLYPHQTASGAAATSRSRSTRSRGGSARARS